MFINEVSRCTSGNTSEALPSGLKKNKNYNEMKRA